MTPSNSREGFEICLPAVSEMGHGKKYLTTKGNNVLQGQFEALYFGCSSSTWEGVSQKHMLKTVLYSNLLYYRK